MTEILFDCLSISPTPEDLTFANSAYAVCAFVISTFLNIWEYQVLISFKDLGES